MTADVDACDGMRGGFVVFQLHHDEILDVC
jgi:hypothetical protein